MLEFGVTLLATQFINMVLDVIEGPIIEIGIGRYTSILSQASIKHEIKYFGCDVDASTCLWARSLSCSAHHGDPLEYSKDLNIRPAVVLLDGEKCGNHLKRIFELFWTMTTPGGLIIIHNFVTLPNVQLQAMLKMGESLNQLETIRMFFFYRDVNNEEMLLLLRDI